MDLGYISKNSQQSLKKSQRKLSNYEKMQINIKKQSKSPNGERLFINDILKVNMQHSWKLLERTDSMQTAHKSPINYIAKPNSVESNNYNYGRLAPLWAFPISLIGILVNNIFFYRIAKYSYTSLVKFWVRSFIAILDFLSE